MELRHLQTFRAVAGHLNFTRAAEELHLAQSSVSAQIMALEEDLGVRLFDRLKRRVALTDAGEKLYDYARRMEEMTAEIRSQVAEDPDAEGSLTVRAPESLARAYMPRVMERFHREYPRSRLSLINCDDGKLREELGSGRIDLAFLLIDQVLYRKVHAEMLGAEPLVFVAGRDHELAGRDRVRPEDLAGRTLLLPKTD